MFINISALNHYNTQSSEIACKSAGGESPKQPGEPLRQLPQVHFPSRKELATNDPLIAGGLFSGLTFNARNFSRKSLSNSSEMKY